MDGCCPQGSLPYLKSDYTPTGKKVSFPALSAEEASACGGEAVADATEAYVVGTSRDPTEAVIFIPDIWGWDSGRTRAIADSIAAIDYKVIIPKVLQPPMEGGTDGDGLPTPFDTGTRGAEFMAHGSHHWTWKNVGPKVVAILKALKSEGVQRFVFVGVCYGAWISALVSKMDTSVVGIFSPHPSISLEQKFAGKDPAALCKEIQCEVFVCPAGNDPADYDEGGAMFSAFKPGSKTVRFPTEKHGFFSRGDMSNEATKKAIDTVYGLMAEWINSKFAPKTNLM